MSFPTSDVIQSEMLFLRVSGIAADLSQAISPLGLRAEMLHAPGVSIRIAVQLPDGRAVFFTPVLSWPGAWHVLCVGTDDVLDVLLPLQQDEGRLTQIFEAAIESAFRGEPLPSPINWGRVEPDAITQLADRLIALGIPRAAIELEPERVRGHDGQPARPKRPLSELRLADHTDPNRTLVVSFTEGQGWAVEQVMPMWGASGRLDLATALGLRPTFPRVRHTDIETGRLASLLADDTSWNDAQDTDRTRLLRYGTAPEEIVVRTKEDARKAAVDWLRWVGFSDRSQLMAVEPTLRPNFELVVDVTRSTVGLPAVQRYMGIAAASGRIPIVVSASWFSKPALTWADSVGMLLFSMDEFGLMRGASAAAKAFVPVHAVERPRECFDETCFSTGCAVEAEFCSINRRRLRRSDALQWRLL